MSSDATGQPARKTTARAQAPNERAAGAAAAATAAVELPEEQRKVVGWQAPEDAPAQRDTDHQWDGTETELPVAFPIMRDHRIVGPPNGTIVVRAAQHPETGRWFGPEADHVEELFRGGMIAGTRQARQRLAETTAVEHARGVYTPQPPNYPEGRTDLQALDTAGVKRQWERVLGRGPADVIRRERQEAKSEATAAQDMAKAAEALARATRVIEHLVTAKERLPQGPVGSSPED